MTNGVVDRRKTFSTSQNAALPKKRRPSREVSIDITKLLALETVWDASRPLPQRTRLMTTAAVAPAIPAAVAPAIPAAVAPAIPAAVAPAIPAAVAPAIPAARAAA